MEKDNSTMALSILNHIHHSFYSILEVGHSKLEASVLQPKIALVLTALLWSPGIFGVCWSLLMIFRVFCHPLRDYPGPKLAAATNLVSLYWELTGQLHYRLKLLHDQYGDVVRIRPNELVYRSSQAWKDIYGHKNRDAGSFVKDPKFYPAAPSGHNIFTAPTDAEHARFRYIIAPAFTNKALRAQETLLQSYADTLLSKLKEEVAISQEVVDLSKWYSYTAFDILGDLAFGEPFDCLQNDTFHSWVEIVQTVTSHFSVIRILLIYPSLGKLVKQLASLIPRRVKNNMTKHWDMSKETLARRLANESERPDFVTYVTKHGTEEGKGMTPDEVDSNMGLLVIAGSESTAFAISAATFFVLNDHRVLERLVAEIRQPFKASTDITFDAVAKLPYLNAVIEESLRMHAPAPGILPRIVPPGGAVIDGRFVPEGTSVSVARYSAFRSRTNFTDPDSFRPERWLKEANARYQTDHKDACQPFSMGRRDCIGKNLAYGEMRIILARIFWTFDTSLDSSCWDWPRQKAHHNWVRQPLLVRLTPVERGEEGGGCA